MTKNEFNARAGAALTTLAEGEGWAPRSHLQLGLRLELNEYVLFESVLVRAGLVTTTNEVVRLTDEGRRLAEKIEESLKRKSDEG